MPNIPNKVNLTGSSVDILNAIRNSATANYRGYVPEATNSADSIREIGAIIMDYPTLQNEFLSALINRIGRVLITSKMYSNPWAIFKQGMLEYGETIEEIFVNLAKPFEFDPAVAENKVFAREIPDVRAAFHILNYQKFYKSTIQNEQLRQAFLSWTGITELIAKIVDSMYTGANYDEFQTMKYMLAKHILNGELYATQIPTVQESNMKSIISTIKGVSNKFEFMSNKYNVTGVENYSLKEDQYLIVNSDFDATMDVDVLASAFNMGKAEFAGHRVLIDSFGSLDTDRLNLLFKDDPNYTPLTAAEIAALDAVPAVLISGNWFMIFDNLYNFTEQYNGEGLYWNYWYHVWKTFSVSPFANAVVFVPGAPAIDSVTVSPSTATISAGQSVLLSADVTTENFASKSVNWTLAGVLPFPTIAVNGSASSGATTVGFDGATVAANALAGRKVKFGSATKVYTITANTPTQMTVSPALAANVADNATITVADSVTGDDLPATVNPLGEVFVKPDASAGTVITATATSYFDNTKSASATITVS